MIYELTIIYKPEVSEGVEETKLKTVLEGLGAKMIKKDWEGVKRLAYEVDGYDEGNYFYTELEGITPKKRDALNTYLWDKVDILRSLLVKQDVRR